MNPLDHAKALTGIVRTAWTGATAASLYVWLTLATLEDIDLFVPERTFTLPVVGTAIEPIGFFIFAPFLLLASFFYFHLMLVRLFDIYSELRPEDPAREKPGTSQGAETLAPPWFLTVLIISDGDGADGSGVEKLDFHPLAFHLAWFFSYAFVPLTIFALSYRYLRAHDPFLTFVHALLVSVVIVAAVLFWRKRCDFCPEPKGRDKRTKRADQTRPSVTALAALVMLHGAALLFLCSQLLVINGPRPDHPFVFLSPNAQLYRAELSKRPAGWDELRWLELQKTISDWETCVRDHPKSDCVAEVLDPNDMTSTESVEELIRDLELERDLRLQTVVGAQLGRIPAPEEENPTLTAIDPNLDRCGQTEQTTAAREQDLRHAFLREAYLVGANLECVDMFHADLRRARLDRASLLGTDLRDADLRWASLDGANLSEARLQSADLRGAHLKSAKFTNAFLTEANFYGAFLNGAEFSGATIDATTVFIDAQMELADFESAAFLPGPNGSPGVNFEKARLNGANFRYAKAQGARFPQARLRDAILQFGSFAGADFSAANLFGADLRNGTFDFADFTRADLTHTLISSASFERAAFDQTVFTGSALTEVDFRQAAVDPENLNKMLSDAFGDGSVLLPDGVERPKGWCSQVLDTRQFIGLWQGWRKARGLPDLSGYSALSWIFETDDAGERLYPVIDSVEDLPEGCPATLLEDDGQ